MDDKKSFVLYFDMYPCIQALPLDQRGLLFSAIFEYAEQEAQEPGSGRQVLERNPELSEAARMAFYFITRAIERDAGKWRERRLRYSRAAEKRWGERLQEGGGAQKGEAAPTVKGRTGGKWSDRGGGNAWDYI